jgi:hypothetical protein
MATGALVRANAGPISECSLSSLVQNSPDDGKFNMQVPDVRYRQFVLGLLRTNTDFLCRCCLNAGAAVNVGSVSRVLDWSASIPTARSVQTALVAAGHGPANRSANSRGSGMRL